MLDLEELDRLISHLQPKPESLLILGAIGEAPARESVVGAFSLQDGLSLDSSLRADLGVVLDAGPDDAAILARLRDVHCKRVLLVRASGWVDNELLALGFLRIEASNLYLCDPSQTPAREWNNADHWANPQNFDKYRW